MSLNKRNSFCLSILEKEITKIKMLIEVISPEVSLLCLQIAILCLCFLTVVFSLLISVFKFLPLIKDTTHCREETTQVIPLQLDYHNPLSKHRLSLAQWGIRLYHKTWRAGHKNQLLNTMFKNSYHYF